MLEGSLEFHAGNCTIPILITVQEMRFIIGESPITLPPGQMISAPRRAQSPLQPGSLPGPSGNPSGVQWPSGDWGWPASPTQKTSEAANKVLHCYLHCPSARRQSLLPGGSGPGGDKLLQFPSGSAARTHDNKHQKKAEQTHKRANIEEVANPSSASLLVQPCPALQCGTSRTQGARPTKCT